MKTKIMKVLGVVMTIAMLASFMVAGAPVTAAGNPASVNNFTGVNLPTMVAGSDVDLIEQANDGTIFISVQFTAGTTFDGVVMGAGTWAMLKSMDGYEWKVTNINNEATRITAIEPSANYSADKTVYVAIDDSAALHTTLYRCTNAAELNTPVGEMGQISAGFGTSFNATIVNDLDSYYDGSDVWLLAATDIDVFAIRDDRGLTTVWTDMQLSETLGGDFADVAPAPGVAVFKAEFAPDYSASGVIWAVFYDDIAKVAAAFNARFPGIPTGSNGYGIIARHSGSTLWGTVITPVIVRDGSAVGVAGAQTATISVGLNATWANVFLPGCNNANGVTAGIADLATGTAVLTTPVTVTAYNSVTQMATITFAVVPPAGTAGSIDIGYTGATPNRFPAIAECDLEFAAGYNSNTNPELYAALSFGTTFGVLPVEVPGDDIYRIECGKYGAAGNVSQFDVDTADRINFCSLEVDGDVLIAGGFEAVTAPGVATEVWYSTNAGTSWQMASKNPTGELDATNRILISKYGPTAGLAFAATGGLQSAISVSDDNGTTWNQVAMIDDVITTIDDIAFYPNGNNALMLTSNAGAVDTSLWKTADVTARVPGWQRTLCTNYSTAIVDLDMVEYSDDGIAIMLYDGTSSRIYRSTDDARSFVNWRDTSSWLGINDWVVPNANTVYAATNSGFWSTGLVGNRLGTTVLESVSYSGDAVIVGGTGTSDVYVSFDKGNKWGISYAIPFSAASDVFVDFDANFGMSGVAGENLAYAATADGIVYQLQLTDAAAVATKVFVGAGTLTGVLTDSTPAASGATIYDGIVVAPDNAMYLSGTVPIGIGVATLPTADVSGTIQIIGDTSNAVGDFVIPALPATTILGVVGTFIDGEVLQIIGDSLLVDAVVTDFSGDIQVRGVTSGATGYITLTNETITNIVGGPFTTLETISVTSSNLLCATTGGAPAGATVGVGMQRLLLHERGNVWESEANAGMSGLWYSSGSNILWTIVAGNTIDVFEDFLSGKVMGVSAGEINASPNTPTKTVKVNWTQLKGATAYNIEAWDVSGATPVLFSTTNFTVPLGLRAEGTALSGNVINLAPLTEYDFYVRVAVDSLNHSRWSSPAVSVTTGAWLVPPTPMSPSQNLVTSSLHPTFTWSSAAGAVSYNIQISDSGTFGTLIDSANVAVTGYTYEGDGLEYDTDYYWRVQSVALDGTVSEWSSYDPYYGLMGSTGAVSVFHTMMEPEAPVVVEEKEYTVTLSITQTNPTYTIPVPEFTVTAPAPPASTVTTITNVVEIPDPQTPAYIWAIVAIGALLTIAVIVLIIRTRRVV